MIPPSSRNSVNVILSNVSTPRLELVAGRLELWLWSGSQSLFPSRTLIDINTQTRSVDVWFIMLAPSQAGITHAGGILYQHVCMLSQINENYKRRDIPLSWGPRSSCLPFTRHTSAQLDGNVLVGCFRYQHKGDVWKFCFALLCDHGAQTVFQDFTLKLLFIQCHSGSDERKLLQYSQIDCEAKLLFSSLRFTRLFFKCF